MTNPKLVIAQVSDTEFVAASTDAPFFCTVGESIEAVRARASQAAQFYQDAIARRTPIAPRITPQVVRVVPYEVETWPAEAAMSAA